MKSEIIYLATPYMNDNMEVMDFRADVSDVIAASLADRGHIVFAPISSWHHIAKSYDLPKDWNFWNRLDTAFIKASSALWIIPIWGWIDSKGVTAETKLALEYRLQIDYIDPEPYVQIIKNKAWFKDEISFVYGKREYTKGELKNGNDK